MKDTRNIIIKKYDKLYWRLHDHPNKSVYNDVWHKDFKWVSDQIIELKDCDSVIRKIDLYSANQLWEKYK